ncbi:MAG: transporter, ATP-binding subunit [Actinomycetia bacterium]|jgi:ABC-2 type transport system ATP-binding protein|nr:transporter, ATP-binding subunit [Actinomycetes bacterium]MDQ1656941.1 type transport system ATP-binding protein [Cryptosporangiaceae bacterium]
MTRPAVEVDSLVKRYGARTAVDGVSLAVPPGTVVALLGPNGAGKTSTVEVCEGYRRPDSGTVRVLGLDPVAAHDELTPRIGVMLQSGGVYPGARAGEMLALVASFAANPLDLAALTERLALGPVANTPYRRLSGGEKQRLSLAMALAGRPELVFLDEPTAGMDPQSRRATWDLVRELRGSGVAVLLTTHFMDEAEQLADQVVIIDGGRVVGAGSPAELTSAQLSSTTGTGQLTFASVPGLPVADLRELLPGFAVAEASPGRYQLTGPVSPAAVATVAAWCAEHNALVAALNTSQRTLEDVFLDLTGRELRT